MRQQSDIFAVEGGYESPVHQRDNFMGKPVSRVLHFDDSLDVFFDIIPIAEQFLELEGDGLSIFGAFLKKGKKIWLLWVSAKT